MGGSVGIICLLPTSRHMTSTDRNDLMPAQEKLEWVTPKISLMGAGETDGKRPNTSEVQIEDTTTGFGPS
jgi:hypothetical protein